MARLVRQKAGAQVRPASKREWIADINQPRKQRRDRRLVLMISKLGPSGAAGQQAGFSVF